MKILSISNIAAILILQFFSSIGWGFFSPTNPNFVDGSLLYNFKTSYFKTTENFDSGGSKQSLSSGNSFQLIEFDSQLRWGLLKDLGLFGGFVVGSAESTNSLATRKNSTVSTVNLGFDYKIASFQSFELFSRLNYIHPIEKIDRSGDSAINSNGATQIIPEIGILLPFSSLEYYGSVGYNYRNEGLSSLLMYKTGLQLNLGSFALYGGVDGSASMTDDKETTTTFNREAVTNKVSAGSKKFYSVNPNELKADLGFNFQATDNWGFNGFTQYSAAGSNSAAGFVFGLGLSWELTEIIKSTKEKVFKPKDDHLSRDPIPSDFKENTDDGVNQEYFKQVPSPTAPPLQSPKAKKIVPPAMPVVESSTDTKMQIDDENVDMTTKKKKSKDDLKIKLKRKNK